MTFINRLNEACTQEVCFYWPVIPRPLSMSCLGKDHRSFGCKLSSWIGQSVGHGGHRLSLPRIPSVLPVPLVVESPWVQRMVGEFVHRARPPKCMLPASWEVHVLESTTQMAEAIAGPRTALSVLGEPLGGPGPGEGWDGRWQGRSGMKCEVEGECAAQDRGHRLLSRPRDGAGSRL